VFPQLARTASLGRSSTKAKAKALQSWTPPTILCLYHTQPNQPHHIHCTSSRRLKRSPSLKRIVSILHHQTMNSPTFANRCAEANTHPNQASDLLPICASNPHIPPRAHPIPRLYISPDSIAPRSNPPCCSSRLAHTYESSYHIAGLRQIS
jgi:hypothetical protein